MCVCVRVHIKQRNNKVHGNNNSSKDNNQYNIISVLFYRNNSITISESILYNSLI